MTRFQRQAAMVALIMLVAACTKRQPAPPPPAAPAPVPAPAPTGPPVPNMFVLLPDPEGRNTSIVVSNSAGTQEIHEANQAVRVRRADTPPSPPFSMDQSMVERLFGAAMRAMPDPEVQFLLYFDEARDTLNADAQAAMASILRAVQERRSTDISVTGHTDRSGTTDGNYQLGLRRAERVAALLRAEGVDDGSLFVTSHGETDQLIKTGPGIAEPRNRRVEVIVH